MSDWLKRTIYYMWLMASVFIMVLTVFFGLMKSPDLRLAIGEVTFGFFAPSWGVLTLATFVVMCVERMKGQTNE